MGNKRKAVAIILGVIVFAAGIISGAFFACKPNQLNDAPVTNAASTVANGGSAKISGSKLNGSETATFNVTSGHVYVARIAGQPSYGAGAIVHGYYKANSSTVSGTIGVGGGKGGAGQYGAADDGGGYSSFPVNFGRPNGRTGLSTGIAGGGGGGGVSHASNYGTVYSKGGAAGYASGSPGTKAGGGSGGVYYGSGATQSAGGAGGIAQPNGSSATASSGSAGSGSKGGNGGSVNYTNNFWAYGGGGGGGYYGGGGGGAAQQYGGSSMSENGGGGGGSCSPNTYYYGMIIGGHGYIDLYDVTPTSNPAGSTVKNGSTATITDGAAQAVGGTKIQWQYSTDNKNWSTTKLTRTEPGTTTVYWRYVITESNVASNESVIASGSLSLTVEQAVGTVGDPTLTGNGSTTYSGNNIQVVTKLGSASGVFKYAVSTKKIDAGAQASTYEAQGLAFASTLDAAQNWVKDANTYYVYYFSDAGNNYLASTVKRATFTVGKASVSLTKGTAAGRTGLVYNGTPQSLFTGEAGCDPDMGTIKYGVVSASGTTPSQAISTKYMYKWNLPNAKDVEMKDAGKYYLCATVVSDNLNNYEFNAGDGWWWVFDIYTVIEKGTVTAVTGIEIKPDRVYDGSTQNFFEVSSAGVKASQGDALSVSYTRNYTLTNFAEAKKA